MPLDSQKQEQERSDIGLSAYLAKLGKKKVNKEKEIEKDRTYIGSWQPHS